MEKVEFSKECFKQAFAFGGSLAGFNKISPILGCVKYTVKGDTMTIESTDGSNACRMTMPCSSDGDFSFAIEKDELISIVSSLRDDTVNLEYDSDTMSVKINHSRGVIESVGQDVSVFPVIDKKVDGVGFSIRGSVLMELVNTASNFVDNLGTRPALEGVSLHVEGDELDVCASDSAILFYDKVKIDSSVDEKVDVILNKNIIPVLKSFCKTNGVENEISVCVCKNNIMFVGDMCDMYHVCVDAKFPNIQAIMPKSHSFEVSVDVSSFVDSLGRISVINQENNVIVASFSDKMSVSVDDLNTRRRGRDVVEGFKNITGGELKIGFGHGKMKKCLSAVFDKECVFKMNDSSRPIVLYSSSRPNRVVLCMPFKIISE